MLTAGVGYDKEEAPASPLLLRQGKDVRSHVKWLK